MKFYCSLLLFIVSLCAGAQTINVLPTVVPESGTYDDNVTITCTFPEGCAGGKYWINGGEIAAQTYKAPVFIDYSCSVSVAGVNESGRIITDVVTKEIKINRVTPPYITATPKEGVRKSNFYATRFAWNNVTSVDLVLDPFKEGGSRRNEPVVWLTNEAGATVASSDYNGIWSDGINKYVVYLYKNFDVTTLGKYVLHVAKNIFKIDGKMYDQELQLNYEVAGASLVPEFTPEEGEYQNKVEVTISYPTDGSAFYQFYKLNGAKAKAYTAPLVITETSTIEAYGMDEDFTSATETSKATYTIISVPEPKVLDAPVITRNGNSVSITGPAGATLKYWMDDDMNTAKIYSGTFDVDHNGRVSCVAYDSEAKSPTVNLEITDFVVDRGELGDMVFTTPADMETVHVRGASPNGRFAAGFVGSDISSKGFLWDVTTNTFQYVSTIFINQIYGVADDGTVYGWRAKTVEIDEQSTDEDFLWGICKNGVWQEQPKGFTANGITGSGVLYGAYNGMPAICDFTAKKVQVYKLDGNNVTGALTAVCDSTNTFGGYVVQNGNRIAAIWQSEETAVLYPELTDTYSVLVTDFSPNGKWAVIGQDYRLNLTTGIAEKLISTTSRTHNTYNPEVLTAIADDGTIFGTYDGSYLSPESGVAMVYTPDNRWRTFANWLLDERGYKLEGYKATSVRAVSNDLSTFLLHAKQLYMGEEDVFTVGLALRNDVRVKHLAPANLTASVMSGLGTVKLTWEAPITDQDDVVSYVVLRDGITVYNCYADVLSYFDKNIEENVTYTYTVKATYKDGAVSDESYPCEIAYASEKYAPVRNLAVRRAGLSGAVLTWDAPVVSMPKLQYYDENSETLAFGTAMYNAEFGIRIPAEDLQNYSGQQIRTFQFIPTGPQQSYTINLYRGHPMKTGEYVSTPFYSQIIDPATLNYGTVNIVKLDTPQNLPSADLYVAVYIESAGNDNMLGVSYEGFRSGYTDLCRIEGIHDKMVAISKNSSQTTEIVLPIGIGICSEEAYNSSAVKQFVVADNGDVETVAAPKFVYDALTEGKHVFSVKAEYLDGTLSEPVTEEVEIVNNDTAYVAINDFDVRVNQDKSVTLSWATPLDDDPTSIHYGDLTPKQGWQQPEPIYSFAASAMYPVTMTAPYADDYEITELFYCPMEPVKFTMMLDDGNGEVLAYFVQEDDRLEGIERLPEPEIGEINYVKLPNPITVSPSINYMITVEAYNSEPGRAPLAYDSSNKWKSGMSNLVNYGAGLTDLSEFVQIDEHPNWLMGMVLRKKNASPMPLLGYDVIVDGQKANQTPVPTSEFTTAVLRDGLHSAGINVIYSDKKTMEGEVNGFEVSDETGITHIDASATDAAKVFDLNGRRVITDRQNRGIYIIGDKKIIK